MALSDIVDVTISLQTTSVSRVGFGTPMIMSAEAFEDARFSTTAKIYTDLDQLGSTGDGFDPQGVTFLKAQKIFGQRPKVDRLVVGKRANLPLMTMDFVPIVKNDTAYTFTIGGRGVLDTFTFTSDATATAAEITAGIVALINAGTQDVLATDVGPGTSVKIESADSPGGAATAGKPYTITFDRILWITQNTTIDPGLAADLSAIRNNIDGNDDWYAAHLDSYGKAEIEALAALIETLKRIYLAVTSDADVLTSATTDVGSNLQALTIFRTALLWHETPHIGPEAAWGGKNLPTDPGSITWKFKTLALIPPSLLEPTELIELESKNVNRYVLIAGKNITCDGKMSGGEFIDVVRGIDFISQRLQEDIFGTLATLPKVGQGDKGISTIENDMRGVLELGVSQGIFLGAPDGPTVSVPKRADIDTNDLANRLLPDMNFNAKLEGAVHAVEINGVVTL